MECGKVSHDFVTMSQMVWWRVTVGHVTVGHMMRVTWGPWESKRIATVVKYISSREMSENSIEFSLSNSEQRDSWLNSGYQTLDTDKKNLCLYSPIGTWSVVVYVKQAHRELVNPMIGSYKPPLAYIGLITHWSSSLNIRKYGPSWGYLQRLIAIYIGYHCILFSYWRGMSFYRGILEHLC